ncbi:phycocyanobilin:ferredoxin oxidoreductase [Prochlorococcus sp. MIT 1223]|uniref:phycocyanobilin:ferredoxin oxidoreductase n=1 Tax=Prochlorococcus sp. MIT 1223 TaxID=3096217 RepID=UPI002A750C40|nr:phycocyanobilin:ferredoxin oxidoreductase [Prochlorococcus sp. MIT 1223]
MLLSSYISGKGLHPLLESTADLIRKSRDSLDQVALLDLDPELRNVYKKVDGDDLFIFNELHQARGFRKLHLELARIGSNLQILHCVFFPDPRFNLPIFGVDLVSANGIVTAAIVDLSPVGKCLPDPIIQKMALIDMPEFKSIRAIPEWGTIFSSNVCFIKPESSMEEKNFLKLVHNYLGSLISYSFLVEPDSLHSPTTIERYNYQKTYCIQQKRNDKTRNVLAKTFSPTWADRYIDIVLFECSPLPKE